MAIPIWIVAFLLFVLPFLRPADGPTWVGADKRAETDIPFAEDLVGVEEELELVLAPPLEEACEELFGADGTVVRRGGLIEPARLAPGREVYELHCSGCHGANGDGAGPAARFLDPRPRNFRKGIFKFTSTPSGERPLKTDLFRVVTQGLSGASMPDFRLLPEESRWDVVEYVRYLAVRGEFEQLYLDEAYDTEEVPDASELAGIVIRRWDPERARGVYPATPETDRSSESIERGRALFLDTNLTSCSTCHGDTGRGDGPTADAYEDDWGYPIRPRDFSAGVFRAGETPEALWRSIATGINGTPMGSFEGNLTSDQIWDLVHFVQHLAANP